MSEMFNEFKWILIVACLCLLVPTDASKISDKKSPQKKASYLKPTKHPKSVLEQFKELPPGDFAFLKEVDKQFKNFGSNLKIKVVKENSTNSKNHKRTINGDVGYGYQSNQQTQGYYFSKPKYEIYPYSQEDIPPLTPQQQQILQQKYGPPNYQPHEVLSSYKNQHYLPQPLHTSVEITPSHGFEIKETNERYGTYSQQNYQPISYQTEPQTGPVIVLRIPGPQKYAIHLQMLLQQYLEVRAAEYIRFLQEQELQQQHSQAHNYQQYSDEASLHGDQTHQNHYHQTYEPSPHYQIQVQPAQVVYQKHEESAVDSDQPIHYSHDTTNAEHFVEQSDDENIYNYHSSYSQQTDANEHYHPVEYLGVNEKQHYVYPKIPSTTESSLQITENFPRGTHTHAYFSKPTTSPSTYLRSHHQSYDDNAPHQQQKQSYQPTQLNYHSDSDEVDYYYENQSDKDYGSPSEQITQTTPIPYNYHAHPPRPHQHLHDHRGNSKNTNEEHAPVKAAKRQTATFTQEQYVKLNKLISRMKKKVNQVQKNKDE
ncbi:hypothetical protein Bhyg_15612 [Pseudolycoriella hygida]|uniref:Uncharacterized protein n=1 Tax=Pseudolycoriella hygida TaxID=35572 RepID=A0A9Q0MKK8_9DIPT|nr:hypothetical protein Bhyg_15612 [Pseudolycoriella hygida]